MSAYSAHQKTNLISLRKYNVLAYALIVEHQGIYKWIIMCRHRLKMASNMAASRPGYLQIDTSLILLFQILTFPRKITKSILVWQICWKINRNTRFTVQTNLWEKLFPQIFCNSILFKILPIPHRGGEKIQDLQKPVFETFFA